LPIGALQAELDPKKDQVLVPESKDFGTYNRSFNTRTQIAPRVRDICRRHGLPYNTGPLHKQLGTVHRTILRLAFPGGKVRPKPGPYTPS